MLETVSTVAGQDHCIALVGTEDHRAHLVVIHQPADSLRVTMPHQQAELLGADPGLAVDHHAAQWAVVAHQQQGDIAFFHKGLRGFRQARVLADWCHAEPACIFCRVSRCGHSLRAGDSQESREHLNRHIPYDCSYNRATNSGAL